ncbi:MAG: dienelactone hydrolase family protein [Acidobacteria bacterium]|nr:dienelactone hydrolase family protein [Acidobacteriota bacterium]
MAQDASLERLNESPRHHEWVEIAADDRAIHTFVVYPETNRKAPVVLVIHENRGLNDWARSVADQLAEAGYIAVAPDLLSGMAPGEGNTADFADTNAARDAIYELNDQQVISELSSVTEWARSLPATSGKIAVAGFCWGGHQAFQFATASDVIEAAFVFYGTPPDDEELKPIEAPVYGFYGESDERITSTVEGTAAAMARAGNVYEPVIYENAGHGFMRSGEESDADPGNAAARNAAWKRWLQLLELM